MLSFSYAAASRHSREGGNPPRAVDGDVVICAPVVRREAREQGKDVAAHHAHLLVHGLLHLQGYDHEGKREASRMERRERRILAGLGFPDPYAERDPQV